MTLDLGFARAGLLAVALIGAVVTPALAEEKPDIENGRYMFHAGGCASCHAAPASDKCDDPKYGDALKVSGGRCLKTAFGTFYVPNITPDKETGIGGWTTRDFIRAMKRGRSPSGMRYYPAFPYASYQRMTVKDLTDMKAFLDTLTPVVSKAPAHNLSFLYSRRSGLRIWRELYLDKKTFKPDPTKSEQVNRGAYLVEGAGHCGECHTPRTWMGGMRQSVKLSGAISPEGKGPIPNITPDATGIGSWSEKDIAYTLESGFKPDGDVMGDSMAAVQANMAHLTPADREAIAAYLKSIPQIKTERKKAE
jgi:mono/diheme cytochrome c family protein